MVFGEGQSESDRAVKGLASVADEEHVDAAGDGMKNAAAIEAGVGG